jgi:ankyrin repeat protein
MFQVNNYLKEGMTPLHTAASLGSEESVIILLKAGAKKDIPDGSGRMPGQLAQNEVIRRLLS